jgi:hypothetical protein
MAYRLSKVRMVLLGVCSSGTRSLETTHVAKYTLVRVRVRVRFGLRVSKQLPSVGG